MSILGVQEVLENSQELIKNQFNEVEQASERSTTEMGNLRIYCWYSVVKFRGYVPWLFGIFNMSLQLPLFFLQIKLFVSVSKLVFNFFVIF